MYELFNDNVAKIKKQLFILLFSNIISYIMCNYVMIRNTHIEIS